MSQPAWLRLRWTQSRVLVVLLGFVALAYLPVFRNGFVYDDTALIVDSRVIHEPRNLPALFVHSAMFASAQYSGGITEVDTYRPVTIATFMWDAQLSGTSPWAYHLTNLIAHLICVWLVYRFALAALAERDRRFAIFAAAWFAFTPIPSEAHVWINGRSDVFATLFGLAGVLAWRRGLDSDGFRRFALLALASVGFLFGLLSKEVLLLCLPAIALWPERTPVGVIRRALRCLPLAAAAVIYLAMRAHALGGMRSHQNAAQLSLASTRVPWLLFDGLMQSLVPTHVYQRLLYEEYGRLPSYLPLLAGIGLLLVIAAAVVFNRAAPAAGWGLLWFALPLAPIAIISTMFWPGFGRYLYLPCAGLAVTVATLAAYVARVAPRLQRFLTYTALGYGVVLIVVLQGFIASYRSSSALYTQAIEARPDLAFGYGALAASMSTQLRDLESVARLLEIAERLDPSVPKYAIHHVQAELVLKHSDRAATLAEQALQRFPIDPLLHYLAAVATTDTAPTRALDHLRACTKIDPTFERCRGALVVQCQKEPGCDQLTRTEPGQ
ncbi:MAG TPA: hypothetical protein VFG30_03820 [Polyangiales bacterium]|nr:hypothetical protein [Polyangiales bacterium]